MLGTGTFPSLSLSELMPPALICAGAGSPNLPVPKPGPQQSAAPRAAPSRAVPAPGTDMFILAKLNFCCVIWGKQSALVNTEFCHN